MTTFGKTKATTSTSTPVFKETWLPGQQGYVSEFVDPFKKILAGDLSSPMAQMLQQITGEAAMKETGRQRGAISGTRGLTAPAKAKAVSKLGGTAISAMAKVPQDIWGGAKELLSQYVLTPPSVAAGTTSETKGGGGWSCCFIFIAGEGQLTQIVRRYRDEHYLGTLVDPGYRWMAGLLVPLMQKSIFIKGMVRKLMTQPLTEYARWWYGERSFTMGGWIAKQFWPTLWKVIGGIKNARK